MYLNLLLRWVDDVWVFHKDIILFYFFIFIYFFNILF